MSVRRMKYRMRDAAIYAADSIRRRNMSDVGHRVLSLHEVKDSGVLEEKILWLKEHYELVPLEKLFNEQSNAKPMVAVTFDDGYQSAYDLALPILEKHHVPAVFFVCSGFVGLEGEPAREFCRKNLNRTQILPPLSKQQLLDIAQFPLFEIGSHTKNHVNLGRNMKEQDYVEEIEGDQRQLEDWTGSKVRWFAYPFGGPKNVNVSVRKYLEKTSFHAAFTIVPGFVNTKEDPYILGRDSLDMNDSATLWGAWLRGAYDKLYEYKERLRPS